MRRFVFEAVFAGGTIFVLFGISISGGFGYFGGENDRIATRRLEACKRAFETLNDESPNPSLTSVQLRALVNTQLRRALKCANEDMKWLKLVALSLCSVCR